MQILNVQTSLNDIYEEMPKFLSQLKEHIKLETLIPKTFYEAYYKDTGRPRGNKLESFIWFFQLENIIGIADDTVFLRVLLCSRELREFCEFNTVPKPSDITTFRERFGGCIELMFLNLVDITEPICRKLDPKKSDYLLYDTTGILANVKENNPKFFNAKLDQAKKAAKNNPGYDPYKGVYSLLPETAVANHFVKHQYINGHFCYAQKVGFLFNGLGILRHISFFDERFKDKHPEVISKKTDNPYLDKEIGDSTSLKPVLSDFYEKHPHFKYYKTFIGDSSFDSYDNYSMLRNEFHFDRMCIPLNPRNSASPHTDFDENGTPLCPIDDTPFKFLAISIDKTRSQRFKWVCHKSKQLPKHPSKRFCVLVKRLVPLRLTADAFILIHAKTFDFIPVFRVVPYIGTIFTVIVHLPNALSISSKMISALLVAGLFLHSLPKLICFLLVLLSLSPLFLLLPSMSLSFLNLFANLLPLNFVFFPHFLSRLFSCLFLGSPILFSLELDFIPCFLIA